MTTTLKDAAELLLSTKPLDLSKRYVKDVSCESMPVTLEIGQLLALVHDKALKRNIVQRNDVMRREEGRAKHVTELSLAHLDIVVAYWDNAFHLVDGCHRVGHWFESRGAELPSHVTVLLKMPKTEAEYLDLYNSYDSKKTTKTRSDAIYGYLRYIGVEDKIKSELLRRGQWVSAFNVLHKSTRNATELDTTRAYLRGILKVDEHNLGAHTVPQGFVLAALRLYQSFSNEAPVASYIEALIQSYTGRATYPGTVIGQLCVQVKRHLEISGSAYNKEFHLAQLAKLIEEHFDYYCIEQTKKPASAFVDPVYWAAPTAHNAVLD